MENRMNFDMGSHQQPGKDYQLYHAMRDAAIAQGCVQDRSYYMPAGGGLQRTVHSFRATGVPLIFDGKTVIVKIDSDNNLDFYQA